MNFLNLIPHIAEYNLLNFYSTLKGHPLRDERKHRRLKKRMIRYIEQGLAEDAELCSELEVSRKRFTPTEIKRHFVSLIEVYRDYPNILRARAENDLKTGSIREYPDYYNRNYHFQTDGYTSEHSARLYDHQVDILFAGMAAPMRRTILEEFRNYRPETVLELACGVGSTTEIVSSHLKEASITSTDLSHEYIDYARGHRPLENVKYLQSDALDIKGEYDCVFHVFLLHELPSKIRKEVLKHQINCLKPGGKGIVLESLQIGDIPFLDEVLYDFPKYYHEPFYKHYIENSVEKTLRDLGAKNIKVTKRLFNKCISFTK